MKIKNAVLPRANIIIVTYNEYKYTERCLSSVLKCHYPNIRIFLVDNASDINTYKSFYNKHKDDSQLTFIRLKKNIGYGGGCNAALEKINDGYIVFLNNDTEVDKDWLLPIIEYMEKNPDVGACQPKIKDIKRKNYFEYAGAAGGFMDIYGFPFSRGRIFYTLEKDKGQYEKMMDLVWCSGTAMVTKAEVIKKIGKFDDIFFMYGEEADLCWRMNHYGYRLVSIPQSIVYHRGMGTIRKQKPHKKIFYLHRNGLILLLKNYTQHQLIKYLPIRVFLDFLAFWYYLFNVKVMNDVALIRAYWDLIFSLPQIVKKRHVDFKKKKDSYVKYPLYNRSIIIDYFIFKRKKFSELSFNQ